MINQTLYIDKTNLDRFAVRIYKFVTSFVNTFIKALIGVKNGIAPLDADALVPDTLLPESVKHVVAFDGTASSGSPASQLPQGDYSVKYYASAKRFVAQAGSILYLNFPTSSMFNNPDGKARTDVIFLDKSKKTFHIADTTGVLHQIATASEIKELSDAMKEHTQAVRIHNFDVIAVKQSIQYGSGKLVSECMDTASANNVAPMLDAIDDDMNLIGMIMVDTSPTPTPFHLLCYEKADGAIESTATTDYKLRAIYTEATNDNIRIHIVKIVFKRDADGKIYIVQPVVKQLDFGEFTEAEIDVLFSDEWCQQVDAEQE